MARILYTHDFDRIRHFTWLVNIDRIWLASLHATKATRAGANVT
jgi:hypothetical protein